MIVNKIYIKKSDYSWTNEISDAFLFEIRSITLSMRIDVYISRFEFKDKEIFIEMIFLICYFIIKRIVERERERERENN